MYGSVMVSPASTPERQVRRWRVAPDRLLAWIGVAGFACYGTLWIVHQAFYSPFGVSVFMVGVGQAQMVTTAAVFALWFVPLLTYLAVVVRFLFSVKPPREGRAPVLEAAFGAVLVIGTLMLFLRVAVLRDAVRVTNRDPSGFFVLSVFVAMVGVLSLALFSRGLAEVLTFRFGYPLIRPALKWWMVRRYLGRDPTSEAVFTIYLPARRAARKRAARRRAGWRRDLQRAGRTYRLALVAVLGLGFFLAVIALILTAQRDAEARIAGRVYETNWVYKLLTPGARARSVQVIAHDPRLRSLEKARVLYLGTHDGTDVLYDSTAKHTLLVPAGSVTLVLPPGRRGSA
jgi:hypothetical protein